MNDPPKAQNNKASHPPVSKVAASSGQSKSQKGLPPVDSSKSGTKGATREVVSAKHLNSQKEPTAVQSRASTRGAPQPQATPASPEPHKASGGGILGFFHTGSSGSVSKLPVFKKKKKKTTKTNTSFVIINDRIHRLAVLNDKIAETVPTVDDIKPEKVRALANVPMVAKDYEGKSIEEVIAALAGEREARKVQERKIAELNQHIEVLQIRVIKEQEKGRMFPKVTSAVPTTLEVYMFHILYYYVV